MSITGSQALDLDFSGHIFDSVSDAELERRWAAVAGEMDRSGIDVLVMQNLGDGIGGYVRYFIDTPALRGYPIAIVFERDEKITVVMHGPNGDDRRVVTGDEAAVRGADRLLSTWTFTSAYYCGGYDAERVVKVLSRYGHGVIGLVGTAQMSSAFADHVRAGVPGATFKEASDVVDRVKVVKSEEELVGIRLCAGIQEQVLEAMLEAADPGRTEFDCVVAADKRSRDLGSDQAVFGFGSAPHGSAPSFNPRRRQHRVLQRGDRLRVLVESNGPGGWYTELGRMAVLGPASDKLHEEAEVAASLQDFCVELFTPGRACREVFELYNDRLADLGIQPERRIHCHGQGYDLVERPLVRADEPMDFAPGMNLACHPFWQRDDESMWMCDNFVIGVDGRVERLHTLPRAVIELV